VKKSRNSPTGRGPKAAHRSRTSHPPVRTSLELLQSLRTIFGSARAHDTDVRRSAGISGSQLWALAEVARSSQTGGLTVNGLSAQMALHQTTASNLVNSLVERRLIRRERDVTDQRIVHLRATAHGKQILLRTPAPHEGLLVDALRRLDPRQLGQLSESLQWIVRLMRRTAARAAGETLMGE